MRSDGGMDGQLNNTGRSDGSALSPGHLSYLPCIAAWDRVYNLRKERPELPPVALALQPPPGSRGTVYRDEQSTSNHPSMGWLMDPWIGLCARFLWYQEGLMYHCGYSITLSHPRRCILRSRATIREIQDDLDESTENDLIGSELNSYLKLYKHKLVETIFCIYKDRPKYYSQQAKTKKKRPPVIKGGQIQIKRTISTPDQNGI
ncbi:hypothetical protein BJX76DRAFT_229054 [Aspergillus varians]